MYARVLLTVLELLPVHRQSKIGNTTLQIDGLDGRAGSPMGRKLRSREDEDGGDELDSEDADSSSDEDEAVFASMGSTGQIVPLNRDMIRAEAEMAMEGKVHALLDDKLKLFDDQKSQLMDLQKVGVTLRVVNGYQQCINTIITDISSSIKIPSNT